MSNESKLLEETEEKLFGMSYTIMNALYRHRQKKLSLLEEKLKTQKLESEKKIKEYETKIESRRNESEIKIYKIVRLREDMKKTRERNMLYRVNLA